MIALQISRNTHRLELRQAVQTVAAAAPGAALVSVYEGGDTRCSHLVRLAASAGLGLVALDESALEPALRRVLTRVERLPRGLRQWLRCAGITDDDRQVQVLSRMLARAVQHECAVYARGSVSDERGLPNVTDMAGSFGLTPRGLRNAFARSGLPSPVQWKIFLRNLVHAVLLQSESGIPITRMAALLGYPDAQALSRALQHSFGVTPTFVRERLGWQWLAQRWHERRGVRNRHSNAGSDHARAPRLPHCMRAPAASRYGGTRDGRSGTPAR